LVGPNGFGRPRRQVPGAEAVEVPGATPAGVSGAGEADENLSKAALKNKKKREAKKAKEAEARAAGLAAPEGPGSASGNESRSPDRRDHRRGHERSRSKGHNHTDSPHSGRPHRTNGGPPPGLSNLSISGTPAPAHPAAENDVPEFSVTSPGNSSPLAKKLRGLQKKIRAIEDLEMRLAGGEKLEDTQLKKIATKVSVIKELEMLEKENL
jgi:translation initiation factor 2A